MGFGQLQTPQLVVGPTMPASMPLLPGTAAAIIPASSPSTAAPESGGLSTLAWIGIGVAAVGVVWMLTKKRATPNRARRNPHRTDFDRLKDCQLEVQALRREVS